MKGSRVETVEAARKEYKKLLEEGWKKTLYSLATSKAKVCRKYVNLELLLALLSKSET